MSDDPSGPPAAAETPEPAAAPPAVASAADGRLARLARLCKPKLSSLLPIISTAATFGLIAGLLTSAATRDDSPMAAGTAGAANAAPAAAKAGPATYDIELGDLYVKPNSITVPRGADVTVHVTNKGSMQHTLALEGAPTPLLQPGTSTDFHWGVINASTQAWCIVPGHKDAGMLLNVVVAGSAAANAAGSQSTAASSGDATIDPNAKPAAGWQPRDPALPPADPATTHKVTFHIQEVKQEVAPGVSQVRWTYNGTAPGPILRGHVGDTFDVTLVNDGTMEHSIDFHASKVSPSVQMRKIKPGETLEYVFKAQYAGIFTYHCGADPMIYHMGNGMFGAVVVDPPNLDKVDKEFFLVQSELYLGPSGQPGDLKKMMSGNDDAVVFNGYYNQYVYAPIKINPGDRVRVWVLDGGPNENTAFHVVGTIFDTVWKEGTYLLKQGNADQGGSQTLDLQPTQGGFVEFTLPDPGTYPFITHKMMNMARGGTGLFQVGN